MPGLTITTRVPPDAGTTTTTSPIVGSSGRTAGNGDVGAAPDAEAAPQNRAPSPTGPPVSPITPTQESARLSGSDSGRGDHHHRQRQHAASTSTSLYSRTPPFSSTTNRHDNNNTDTNISNIPIFAQGRPTFTHSQPDQIGIPPPPPQPIVFDNNPDVLALKSAITILQLQRQRATADIQALNRAKVAALSDPGAFVADLAVGRIGTDGDPLLNGPGPGADDDDNDGDSDEDDEEDHDENMKSEEDDTDDEEEEEEDVDDDSSSLGSRRHDQDGNISMTNAGAGAAAGSSTSTLNSSNNNSNKNHNTTKRKPPRKNNRINKQPKPQDLSKTWRTLPKPQTVVRCPPINWAQYAVVGESLDKLHREQLTAPTLGKPAVLSSSSPGPSSGGVYEFRGTATRTGTGTVTAAAAGGGGGGGGVPGSSSIGRGGSGDITAATTAADRRTPSSATPPTMNTAEGYVNAIGDTQGQGQMPRHQQSQRLVGIAAPYAPGRDQINRTTARKGSKQ